MVYVPPINIPLGTYVRDGLRSGPSYTSLNSNDLSSNTQLVSGYYNNNGIGVLYTPYSVWDMVPYATTAGNISAAAAITAAGNLTLRADGSATTSVLGGNGSRYIQFDWPRVPAVVVAGAAMAGPTNITIFGYDWYGFPLQHTYVVQATGTYPANLDTPAKAFYRITRVYSDGSTGVGGTVAIQTSDIFGLPYVIREKSYATNFSWNSTSLMNLSGSATLVAGTVTVNTPGVVGGSIILTSHQSLNATPAANAGVTYISSIVARTSFAITSADSADASTIGWSIPNGGENLIAVADASTPTALTGDVRGLIALPTAPDATKRLVFSPYVSGSNTFQNQLAAGGQPEGAGTVPPLTKGALYGRSQYYTGTV